MLVAERKVCLKGGQMAWLDSATLTALGFTFASHAGEPALAVGNTSDAVPLYYLGFGTTAGDDRSYHFVGVDVAGGAVQETLGESLSAAGHVLQDLRSALFAMSQRAPQDLAHAGHAVALSQWHNSHGFCNRCGAATTSIAGGAKRRCTGTSAGAPHQLYPRTDPVVIMLVESASGEEVLLGRSKKIPPGMLSCLAGFIDQGETIEEAVAREVFEESGIVVDPARVRIVGSQPWPLGRGASNELMIGCVARATNNEFTVDPEEMEECRWVSLEEAKIAIEHSMSPDSPYVQRGGAGSGPVVLPPCGFYVPPPLAIAHHLIRGWVKSRESSL